MNKIIKIANYDLDKYKKQFKEAYIVELDGEKIRSWKDYIKFATKLFKIENLEYGYNQHIDNMEDRDYFLNVNSILLIVHNYNKFMKFRKRINCYLKKYIEKIFFRGMIVKLLNVELVGKESILMFY